MGAIYQSSKGPLAVDEMPYPYLKNAAAKLRAEYERVPESGRAVWARLGELAALEAKIAERDAEYQHEQEQKALRGE